MTHDHELRRRIGLQLRQMYQDTLDEELSDDFIEKLCDAAVRVEARKQREEQRRRKAGAGSDGPVPDFRHSRRSQDRIGHRLKQDYAKVLTEDVPQELIELLCEYAVKREAEEKPPAQDAARPKETLEERLKRIYTELARNKPAPDTSGSGESGEGG